MVLAVTYWDNPRILLKISEDIGEPMRGLDVEELEVRMQERGW
jgi:pyridoxal 5'-phosphate synthase pdxS subunit